MAIEAATISFDIADMLGDDFDPRRTKVWVSTNVPDNTVVDTVGNKIRLGSGNVTMNADGTGSLTVWVPSPGSNPASWQTTIHVDYPDRNARGGRDRRDFGPYTITGTANLAALVEEQEIPPTYVSQVTAQLDAKVTEASGYADDAAASAAQAKSVAEIDTSDALMASVASDPASEFAQVQSATFATVASVATKADATRVTAAETRVSKAESLLRVGGGSPPVDKQTAVIVGDSIVSQNASQYNTTGATMRCYNAIGWFNHAQALLGHRFRLLHNAGISGETSTQILARFSTDVTSKSPGWAIFGGPTNDATAVGNSTLTLQQVKDNYTAMWDACDTAGIRVVQCVITPRNATDTTAAKAAMFQINQWLREQARNRPKFALIDWYADLASGVDVDWKANYISSGDASGLHPNPRGAYYMGKFFAERVAPLTAAVDTLPNSEAELLNLVNVTTGAALARGTTGLVGTGGTGQVATGWRVDPLPTASFTCSKVARTDGLPGEWQQVVVASGQVKIGVNVTGFGTTYNTNDEIYAIAEFEQDGDAAAATGNFIRLNLIAMKADFGVGRQSIDMDVPSTVEFAGGAHFPTKGVLMTAPVVVPSTATLRMALQFEVKGAGTVRVGRIGMYKVGTGPGADVWSRSDAPLS